MAKSITTKTTSAEAEVKQPRTIKVKTLIIAICVVVGLIASFYAGIVAANHYNDGIKAEVSARVSELSKR